MKTLSLLLMASLVLMLAIQLIPVKRTNPAVTGDVKAPEAVRTFLKRACYDCHSHETRWPWYSRVAPVSWFIAHDVKEGRNHLNFSTWTDTTASGRDYLRGKIIQEVESGGMPPAAYAWMHPAATTNAEDVSWLKAWAEADKGR
jgi:hypothetical protein